MPHSNNKTARKNKPGKTGKPKLSKMWIENEENCGMKQAPEKREGGIGERDKECRRESQEDRTEQRFC